MNLGTRLNKLSQSMEFHNSVFNVEVPYDNNNDIGNSINEFLIVLKPELFMAKKRNQVFDYIEGKFDEYEINVCAIYSSNGKFNTLNSVFENHYFVLNRGSQYGFDRLPQNYKKIIIENCGDSKIISSYSFLKAYGEITPFELQRMSHATSTIKAGNGTYLFETTINGEKYCIINAFHPFQIEHFNNESHMTVFIVCSSATPYSQVGEKLIGFFNPLCAEKGSIRSYLFDRREELGYKYSSIFNGIHNSPSPFEALPQINRLLFFQNHSTIERESIYLWKALKESGFSETLLLYLFTNPMVYYDNKFHSLFDLLEGKDSTQIILILHKIYRNKIVE